MKHPRVHWFQLGSPNEAKVRKVHGEGSFGFFRAGGKRLSSIIWVGPWWQTKALELLLATPEVKRGFVKQAAAGFTQSHGAQNTTLLLRFLDLPKWQLTIISLPYVCHGPWSKTPSLGWTPGFPMVFSGVPASLPASLPPNVSQQVFHIFPRVLPCSTFSSKLDGILHHLRNPGF